MNRRADKRRHCAGRCLLVLALSVGTGEALAAAVHYGQVTLAGVPVPGATVTAVQGEKRLVTVTDQDGVYRFAELADGVWTIRIEMLGFSTLNQDITISADAPPAMWELELLPLEEIARNLPLPGAEATAGASQPEPTRQAGAAAPAPASSTQGGFQPTAVNAANLSNPSNASSPSSTSSGGDDAADLAERAADGLLVNGSVNNGAASPFAQLAAFGNNRRGARSLYNWGLGIVLGNSAWDARPFSFATQPTAKPAYDDLQMLGTFGGPVRIPRLSRNPLNVFVGYQRMADHNATTQPARMPTLLERGGDFSETRDPLGRPIQIIDPLTGRPFAGNLIPPDRISPQAASLVDYYPTPNLDTTGRYNHQAPILVATRQDNVQSRFTELLTGRTQVFGNVAYQRAITNTTSLFGFEDANRASSIDAAANFSHRFSQFFSLRLRYQFTRQTTEATPYFANRRNVSGEAGVMGNNQEPANWGPSTLVFSSGLAGLSDAQRAFTRTKTHAWSAESLASSGRHNVTFGGGFRRQRVDVLAQQDPRGTFTFTGEATGSDLADFLLGLPHTSSIAFGNADKYLRASIYEAYVTDDWRVSSSLTVNAGIRWEYEAPPTERYGRLVNLDVTPGFTAVSAVVAADPVGALTGRRYSDSLVSPDKRGFQPRVGVAWRPVAGSSLVIRAGYGVYRNTAVYQSIALLLAQQPPLSKTLTVGTSAAVPLTLANGFIASPSITPNTFAADPGFRVGDAQNWQVLLQRDLPASLAVTATYLGAKGSHLMQEFLPNTYPSGAVNPCPICPAGFVYLTSNGRSIRHAGQLQVRRRLRNGLAATVQYTLSKATDDAGAFTGVSLTGGAIAQDWLDLDAERGPSSFDQRQLVSVQVQYTTGVGVVGGSPLNGVKGSLLKGWTVTSQLTAGSGLPLTPLYLTSVAGTGVTGTIRGDATGAPAGAAPPGFYVNPAGYAPPAPGRWGTAGRNSITGPAQFALNAGVLRTFLLGDRLNLDWRVEATNVLNRVTYASANTIVGSPQFGLPNRANSMRKVQTTLRLRF